MNHLCLVMRWMTADSLISSLLLNSKNSWFHCRFFLASEPQFETTFERERNYIINNSVSNKVQRRSLNILILDSCMICMGRRFILLQECRCHFLYLLQLATPALVISRTKILLYFFNVYTNWLMHGWLGCLNPKTRILIYRCRVFNSKDK